MSVASASKIWPVNSSPYHTQRVVEAVKIVVHMILKNVISWNRCAGGKFRSGLFLEFIINLYQCAMVASLCLQTFYVYLIELDHTGKSMMGPCNLPKVKGTVHTRHTVEHLVQIDRIRIYAKSMLFLFGELLLV